jgi:hypothetical protein
MNSLFSLIGTEDFELVDVLFALWGEGGNGVK